MLDGARRAASTDFAARPFALAGSELVADRSGALHWPDEQALVVADLHLEKGSAFARRGRMLPPYDTVDTLARLAAVIELYRPRLVIALGDSLHDRGAADRLWPDARQSLAGLQHGRDWLWITGNHDPEIPPLLGGEVADAVTLSGITLRHEPSVGSCAGEIAGHLHPAARLATGSASIRRACFAADDQRLVLPAFGAFAGGLNVLDTAFEAVLDATRLRVLMLGSDGVYPVATRQLSPD